ncbi:MAG: DnaA regulatory inactivator Hda [Gammaproteobacteria bacterium]|nr:DnaA regulatory inactivator Hda [Gammaproteobacteria bacterium]
MIDRPATPRQIPLPFAAARRVDFDTYWSGANRELVEQLRQLASGDARRNVFLWGAPGSGKSHLLHASCNLAQTSLRSAALVPLSQRGAIAPELLEELEHLDLICIDDLDRIAGERVWETAIFNLFNRVREQGSRLLMTCRASPRGSELELADLSSRLSWDLVYHVVPLDEPSRFAALQQRARLRGMEVPDDVLEFLSRRIGRDTHTLFEWLEKLDVASLEAKRKLTVPFVRDLLSAQDSGTPSA